MNSTSPGSRSKLRAAICCCVTIVAAMLCAGCAWVQKNPNASQRIADSVAYDVADVLLAEHPDWRPKFQAAANQLALLETQPQFDALAVIEILRQIPADQLKTPRARIGFDTGMLIIELVGDPTLNPQSEAALRTAVHGLWLGLTRRLNQP